MPSYVFNYGYGYGTGSIDPDLLLSLKFSEIDDIGTSYVPTDTYTIEESITMIDDSDEVRTIIWEKDGLGDTEYISNGVFDDDTGWTLGSGWTISGGKLNANLSSWANATISTGGFANGTSLQITYEVTDYTSGTISLTVGGIVTTSESSAGIKTQNVTTTNLSATTAYFRSASFVGSIDNITIREVADKEGYYIGGTVQPILNQFPTTELINSNIAMIGIPDTIQARDSLKVWTTNRELLLDSESLPRESMFASNHLFIGYETVVPLYVNNSGDNMFLTYFDADTRTVTSEGRATLTVGTTHNMPCSFSNAFVTDVIVTTDDIKLITDKPEIIASLYYGNTDTGLSFVKSNIVYYYPCNEGLVAADIVYDITGNVLIDSGAEVVITNYLIDCRERLSNTVFGLSNFYITQDETTRLMTGMRSGGALMGANDGRYIKPNVTSDGDYIYIANDCIKSISGNTSRTVVAKCDGTVDECIANEQNEELGKILPLGDSITVGIGSATLAGWRGELWTKLRENSYSLDYIGEHTDGAVYQNIDPTFDISHQGVNGITASAIDLTVDAILNVETPDIVLLNLGTNDLLNLGETPTAVTAILQSIIEKIIAHDPLILTIVSQINDWDVASQPSPVPEFNALLKSMVIDKINSGSNLRLVDIENTVHWEGLASANDDLSTSPHPNDAGYSKMAIALFNALSLDRRNAWLLDNYTILTETEGGTDYLTDEYGLYLVDDAGTPPTQITEAEASSFLSKLTFGATETEIDALVVSNDYEALIDAEILKTPSYLIDWMETNSTGVNGYTDLAVTPEAWETYSDRITYVNRDAFWHIAVHGTDQLRQRIALALSDFIVVSRNGALINEPLSRVAFHDLLIENAFGTMHELLTAVTYSSAMGKYLSHLGNQKEDLATGRHPDENYAREIMQLFSIGLYEENLDGTYALDVNGDKVPTYLQDDIEMMARVMTGLSDQNGFFSAGDGGEDYDSMTLPMIPYEQYHDTTEKVIMGVTIPSGQTIAQDISDAIDILVNHQNAAPFLARHLIQRLVTSNPSPEYIGRVSAKFVNNGSGVVGDLKAVIKAVLLDNEALATSSATAGKPKQPYMVLGTIMRAFEAQNNPVGGINDAVGTKMYEYPSFNFHDTGYAKQENISEAISVFNWFSTADAPYSLKQQGLVAPETKVIDKGLQNLIMGIVNQDSFVYGTYNLTIDIQVASYVALYTLNQTTELIDKLDLLLLGGTMRTELRSALNEYIVLRKAGTTYTDEEVTRHIIGLVLISPDFLVQRQG